MSIDLSVSATRPASRIRNFEDWFCGALMSLLMIAGLLSVMNRFWGRLPMIGEWMTGTFLSWPEPLSQHLVLWVALFGASAAAAEGSHIAIDVLAYILPQRPKRIVEIFTSSITTIVCSIFTYLSIVFVLDEIQHGSGELTFFGLRSAYLTVILSAGFLLLAVRSLGVVIANIRDLHRPSSVSVADTCKNRSIDKEVESK